MKRLRHSQGFTIIEVLIVLVIVSVILVLLFGALPALQRNSRNAKRDHDAAHLLEAIGECVNNHNLDTTACTHPSNIPLPLNEMSIYTGVHYGAHVSSGVLVADPPTNDEPNWIFGASCGPPPTGFRNVGQTTAFVVTYLIESKANVLEIQSKCFDGR